MTECGETMGGLIVLAIDQNLVRADFEEVCAIKIRIYYVKPQYEEQNNWYYIT